MTNKITLLLCFLSLSVVALAQTSDDAFRKPLADVLADIQQQFGVSIRYTPELVKDRWITYAGWRYRPDLEKTLTNVLTSQDISFTKEGDKKYKLGDMRFYMKTVEEGKEQLDYFLVLYHNTESWEKRRDELKACMLSALKLSRLPARPPSAPIITPARKMDGYTVENIAIETLPGLYVCGSLYRPLQAKGKLPVILNPDGHFSRGRYRADCQYRCAMQAKMGAMAFSYDLFGWDGESQLQVKPEDHRRSIVQSIQALNTFRILDYLLSLPQADPARVAITGGSGGGSQTMLVTALDNRITLSVPVVMVSAYHSGGCPCENGMGVHLCGNGTNNVEIAAMAAPRPQLVISDGGDWTQHVPENEFPYLQQVYGFYGKTGQVQNAHLPTEGHDYGPSKRKAMYAFVAEQFRLNTGAVKNMQGDFDEGKVTIEKEPALYVFGEKGKRLPSNAIKGFEGVQQAFEKAVKR